MLTPIRVLRRIRGEQPKASADDHGQVTVIAVDQTGTLTEGSRCLTDIVPAKSRPTQNCWERPGFDVASETTDVALMSDNLNDLPFAMRLSRATPRFIRHDRWISLGMVALLVPATLMRIAIGLAAVLHEDSTIVAVSNALRLLASWKPE